MFISPSTLLYQVQKRLPIFTATKCSIKKIPKFTKHATQNWEAFSTFRERYNKCSVEQNIQLFVTEEKRGKQTIQVKGKMMGKRREEAESRKGRGEAGERKKRDEAQKKPSSTEKEED